MATSPSRTTVALVAVAVVLATLALGACVLAAVNDAQAGLFEEQGRHLAEPTLGVEVVQGGEAQAWSAHASHALRHGAVNA